MRGKQNPKFGRETGLTRQHLLKVPARVRRWLLTGRQQFWPIRCPHCRQFTRQMHAGTTPTGGLLRLCVPGGHIFSRKESRDAQKRT